MASRSSFDPATVLRVDERRLQRAFVTRNPEADDMLRDAQARMARRCAGIPAITYPDELPITAHADEIRALITRHNVVIVAGETGSGKTTQLPKICLEAGLGRRGQIAHTQPRRIAARAVAARVAEELGVTLGNEVGYAVRFSDRTSQDTLVKVQTDGLLLTEIRRDKNLSAYDVVIVDEAHERSLNIDFLLGYLRALMARRQDLKLIITSATIDVEQFSKHFGGAPIVRVSGRGYPVEVVYQDPAEFEEPVDAIERALDLIESRPRSRASDVLVFLPGEREILDASRALRGSRGERWEVLPLYARLPASEQQRIFSGARRQRIVLTTNVAETSLTVPNVGYVIDTGYVRMSRYSFRSKLQRLPVERVSRASADQRQGRCGRIAPGLCIRLFSEADHDSQPEYTDPEIRRTNLAAVVLQMRAFSLGEVSTFPFIDPPDPRALKDALTLLAELGAIDGEALTDVGRDMARLPVDPRLARMLVESARRGALQELLVIVSGLSIVDPRERPIEHRAAADAAHREFRDDRSDFLSLVRLWSWHEDARQTLGASALKRACRERFLSANRLREWRDLHRQLVLSTRALGWRANVEPAPFEAVHRAVLSGSLSLIGLKNERGDYSGARNLTFSIFPGSALAKAQPRWLVAAEITETARIYARCVAAVEPRWIEDASAHLLKRSHGEPHWDPKRGEVVAFERATLYGLAVVERRRVGFKRIDRARSREIFIRDGLIPGALDRPPACIDHNVELIRQIKEMESKARRRDLLVSDEVLFAFYDTRLPADIADRRTFESFRKHAEGSDGRVLFMNRADLLAQSQVEDIDRAFPSVLTSGEVEYALKYSFAPGAIDDGVSIQVPLGLLHGLNADRQAWMVPGLIPNQCEQMLRSLPKSLRRQLTPIPDKVDALSRALLRADRYAIGRFDLALARLVEQLFGVKVAADAWHTERLPDYLRINVQVRDESGRLIAQGRDVDVLREQLAGRISKRLDSAAAFGYEIEGLESFPDAGVPERQVLADGASQAVVFPALVERGERVDLIMAKSPEEQARLSVRGYTRLVQNADRQTSRHMRRLVKQSRALGLHYAALGTAEQLCDEVLHASTWHCFFAEGGLTREADAFRRRLAERRADWMPTFVRVMAAAGDALSARFDAVRRLDSERSPAYAAAVSDMREQLDALMPADFLSITPLAELSQLPRYLQGIVVRLEGLQGKVARDAQGIKTVRDYVARLERLRGSRVKHGALEAARFALEELRIALFAQRLGTRFKMSPKRMEDMVAAMEVDAGLR